MADAADEPTLKAFPEFPGEAMSKRCGATRGKTRRRRRMARWLARWMRGTMDGDGATRREEDDDDGDGTVDARLTTHARARW